MKKSYFLLFTISMLLLSTIQAQTPQRIHPEQSLPPNPGAINIVILGDGYDEDALGGSDGTGTNHFSAHAAAVATELLSTAPFSEYRNYFNIWKVEVESDAKGVDIHCSESAQCGAYPHYGCTGDTDFSDIDYNTVFNVGYDGISPLGHKVHRLARKSVGAVVDELATLNSPPFNGNANLSNTVVILMANCEDIDIALNPFDHWIGSGDPNLTTCPAVTSDVNGNSVSQDERIVAHEFAHSFAGVWDEYYIDYSEEWATHELNMSNTNVPENVPWYHWYDDQINNQWLEALGVYPHDVSSTDPDGPNWWKPTQDACKMEVVSSAMPYCAVCREAIVKRIHELVGPVSSFKTGNTIVDVDPTVNSFTTPVALTGTETFTINPIYPEPNTLEINWTLDGNPINAVLDPNDGSMTVTLNCSDLHTGDNILSVSVVDPTVFTYNGGGSGPWIRLPSNGLYDSGNNPWNLNEPYSPDGHDYNQQTITWNINVPTELYVSDNTTDGPLEENPLLEDFWSSPDIWVVNANGVIGNPVSNTTAQVKVLVTNHGCAKYEPNTGGTEPDQIDVRWAKASTALSWENNWDGNWTIGAALMGAPLSPIMLNVPIDAGQSVELSTNWSVPDQADYASIFGSGNPDVFFDEADHFCLLARIVVSDDAMNDEWPDDAATWNLSHNVKYNNNIALRNVVVVDPPGAQGGNYPDDHIVGGAVYLGNPTTVNGVFDLEFNVPKTPIGNPITKEAEIKLTFDNETFQNWVDAGQQGNLIEVSRLERNQVIIKGDHAKMYGIPFSANKIGGLHVSFNFLTKKLTGKEEFIYSVAQLKTGSTQVLGGETFHIRPEIRAAFIADPGPDKTVDKNAQVTVSATDITEPAIYNWYDMAGNLVYTGKDLTVTADITKKYKLEVIATLDGYKDYSEVEVKVKMGELTNITPNPASNQTVIDYHTQGATSAYISVHNVATGSASQYIINLGQGSLTLDLTGYATGNYTVLLVADGVVRDNANLFVQ